MTALFLANRISFSYQNRALLITILIAILMSPVFYFLFNNYSPANFALSGGTTNNIYLLRSETTINRLKSFGNNGSGYEKQLDEMKTLLSKQGYDVQMIDLEMLKTLKTSDTLFVLDAIAMTSEETASIVRFVEEGGSLIFNQYSGFSGPDGGWRGDAFVREITGLEVDPYINTLKKQTGIFCTPKVFSPLTTQLKSGPLLSFVYYEDIPLFRTPKTMKPDMMYTDWTQYNSPKIDDVHLPSEFSGALWHGSKGKGSWVYFNFPSYVFFSSGADNEKYSALWKGIVRFAIDGVAVRIHPYLSGKNPVFISEDTEFRYENSRYFSEVIKELQVPSTAFCVSMLAERFPEVTRELGENSFLEVGSHSHTHGDLLAENEDGLTRELLGSKQILETLSQSKVTGFRPPREEINDRIAQKLLESGYEYTMEKNKNHLYPTIIRKDLVVISRVGTDDFSFIANHTLDEEALVKTMLNEASFIDALDGIYTLSIHTHLFSDPHNISIVRSILRQLKEKDTTTFRQGRDIAKRIKMVSLIDTSVSISHENYIVSLINNNKITVPEVIIRLYWPRFGNVKSIKADTTGVSFTYLHNSNERYTDITFTDLAPRKQFSLLAAYR